MQEDVPCEIEIVRKMTCLVESRLITEIEGMLEEDVTCNKKMGKYGADDILNKTNTDKVVMLTHCNTGSLATSGYGTALGFIYKLLTAECEGDFILYKCALLLQVSFALCMMLAN